MIHYRSVAVDGVSVFYREAGDPKAPTLLLLAAWGKNDPFNAEVRFLDTGHFALETHASEIAPAIRDFLTKKVA